MKTPTEVPNKPVVTLPPWDDHTGIANYIRDWYGNLLPVDLQPESGFPRFAASTYEMVRSHQLTGDVNPITVDRHSQTAYTTGVRVTLPARWMSSELYDRLGIPVEDQVAVATMVMNGLQIHETFHINWTQFPFERALSEQPELGLKELDRTNPHFGSLLNIVEDLYIEHRGRIVFPRATRFVQGVADVLIGDTSLSVLHQMIDQTDLTSYEQRDAIMRLFIMGVSVQKNRRLCRDPRVMDLLGDRVIAHLDAVLDETLLPIDRAIMTRDLLQLLEDRLPPPPEPSESDPDEGDDQAAEDGKPSDGEDDDEMSDDDQVDDKPSEPEDDGDDENAPDDASGDGEPDEDESEDDELDDGKPDEGEPEDDELDDGEPENDENGDEGDGKPNKLEPSHDPTGHQVDGKDVDLLDETIGGGQPDMSELDRIADEYMSAAVDLMTRDEMDDADPSELSIPRVDDETGYADERLTVVRADVTSNTSRSPRDVDYGDEWRAFSRYMQHARQTKTVTGRPLDSGGQLVSSRLARLITDGKVMAIKDRKMLRRGKPQVIVLVDASGSMAPIFNQTIEAAMGMYVSLASSRVPVSVYAHTSTGPRTEPLVVSVVSQQMPVWTTHVVNTGDVQERFNQLAGQRLSQNFDGYAIREVMTEFSDTPGTRVLIVLSDGQPLGGGRYHGQAAVAHTVMAIREARRLGIIVFSVSLTDDVAKANDLIYGEDFNVRGFGDELNDALRELATIIATPAKLEDD